MTIQIENYGFMLVLYVLCFVYLFYPNTEYVCLIFMIILNLFYLLLFYTDIKNSQVRIVIILWWLSLMISNSWLINTYRNLRKQFENSESGINLGDNNQNIKKQILILLVCNIVLFIIMHLLSIETGDGTENLSKISLKTINSKDAMKIITMISGVVISSILLNFNYNFSTNTKIITTQ